MKKIAVWSAGMTVPALSLLVPLASRSEPQAPSAQFIETTVQPREAFSLIQKNKDNPQFVVLDVRTPEEFGSGHVDGAINIDYNSGGFKTLISESRQDADLPRLLPHRQTKRESDESDGRPRLCQCCKDEGGRPWVAVRGPSFGEVADTPSFTAGLGMWSR